MIAVVDSGTTQTRVRLWADGEILGSQSRPVGARDTAADGHPGRVKAALTEMLAGQSLEAVLCSGMITANVGLLEVPHLAAPCSPLQTALGIVRHDFPEVSPAPFFFIPGVKTLPPELGLGNLARADVLRGEEAEIAGLRDILGLEQPALFMHYGSHHKAIQVDGEGRVLGSATSPTGELLAAVRSATVLAGSLAGLEGLEPDPEFWRAGLEASRREGFGRALFLVRVGEQLAELGKPGMTSYLLGVLTSLDLPLVEPALENRETVVLYGGGAFPPLMKAYLDGLGYPHARLVEPEAAERCAVVGAVRLYGLWRRGAG